MDMTPQGNTHPTTAVLPAVQVGLTSSDSYALARNISKDLAASDLVPKQFRGNAPNCLIALNMANRIGADVLMVMQNLYIVDGSPTWSSQFLIACFNKTPGFSKLRYEFDGKEGADEWRCRAYAVERETGETLYGSWISIKLAKAENWYEKKMSKWKTMPQQMLMYRAAAWFVRAYAPEIAMGLQTKDEVEDIYDMEQGEDRVFAAAVKREANGELLDIKELKSLPAAKDDNSRDLQEAAPDKRPPQLPSQSQQPQTAAGPGF
jgi:hypothetical protein